MRIYICLRSWIVCSASMPPVTSGEAVFSASGWLGSCPSSIMSIMPPTLTLSRRELAQGNACVILRRLRGAISIQNVRMASTCLKEPNRDWTSTLPRVPSVSKPLNRSLTRCRRESSDDQSNERKLDMIIPEKPVPLPTTESRDAGSQVCASAILSSDSSS